MQKTQCMQSFTCIHSGSAVVKSTVTCHCGPAASHRAVAAAASATAAAVAARSEAREAAGSRLHTELMTRGLHYPRSQEGACACTQGAVSTQQPRTAGGSAHLVGDSGVRWLDSTLRNFHCAVALGEENSEASRGTVYASATYGSRSASEKAAAAAARSGGSSVLRA